MIMYIDTYALTFLRLFVLWALAVIFLLMAGVTVFIFLQPVSVISIWIGGCRDMLYFSVFFQTGLSDCWL